MIGRRSLLAGAAGLLAFPSANALPVPATNRLEFRILRKGSQIGTHFLRFSRDGEDLTVEVAADIVIGLGPIAFFRYRHRATERWRNDQVVSVDAETDDDGTRERMTARRDGMSLVVEGTKAPRYVAPPTAMPATHWNRRMLDGPLINTQNGLLMRPTVRLLGPGQVPTADGGNLRADHVTLRGDADLDTWYDSTPAWVGLRFTAKDGSVVEYRRG